MSEMVERVAAVFAAELMELTADQRVALKFPDDVNGDTCDRARSAARAAIEAMREPTEGMVDADTIYPITKIEARNVWQAMIDEALKG